MLIAKIIDGTVSGIADYRDMFPHTSFSASGPSKDFLLENSCLPVTLWKPHSAATQKLIPAAPYIESEQVFTVRVVDKTDEDLAAEQQTITAMNRASRAAAYTTESDPIFFKAQRGEATNEEWLTKVQEIRDRFPV